MSGRTTPKFAPFALLWFRVGREQQFGVQPELAQQAETTPKGRPLVAKREVSGKAANKSPQVSRHRKVAFCLQSQQEIELPPPKTKQKKGTKCNTCHQLVPFFVFTGLSVVRKVQWIENQRYLVGTVNARKGYVAYDGTNN